jgi:hypothetical protein
MPCCVECADIAEYHFGEVGLSDLGELFVHVLCNVVCWCAKGESSATWIVYDIPARSCTKKSRSNSGCIHISSSCRAASVDCLTAAMSPSLVSLSLTQVSRACLYHVWNDTHDMYSSSAFLQLHSACNARTSWLSS